MNIPQNIAPNENYIVVIITQLGLPLRYSVRFDNLMKPPPQKKNVETYASKSHSQENSSVTGPTYTQ